jgi:hypothetical protein
MHRLQKRKMFKEIAKTKLIEVMVTMTTIMYHIVYQVFLQLLERSILQRK